MEIKPFEKKVWLASPKMHGDEQYFVEEAFRTNWVSTVGRNLDEFENSIKERLGTKYAVALASGTSALHLSLKLTGLKPGEKVFCTDMTFSATCNPIRYEFGEPIFIDSERETWNMDPVALEKAFEKYPETRVVIVANLYGTPAKLDLIKDICKRHNALLIEDAAESLGATLNGQQTGTFGHYNALSFNGNKIITTSGGGMLVTESEEAALKVKKWSTQSREPAPWYQHNEIGYNYRLSNILAGIGRGQMRHLDEHIALKKAIYERYQDGLKDLPISMNPYIDETMEPNYWLSCLLIDKDAMCKQTRSDYKASYIKENGKTCPTEILEKLAGINAEGRPIWKPMHMQPFYEEYDFITAEGIAVDEDIFDRGLCLPSDINMTIEQQDRIIEAIRSCFK